MHAAQHEQGSQSNPARAPLHIVCTTVPAAQVPKGGLVTLSWPQRPLPQPACLLPTPKQLPATRPAKPGDRSIINAAG